MKCENVVGTNGVLYKRKCTYIKIQFGIRFGAIRRPTSIGLFLNNRNNFGTK